VHKDAQPSADNPQPPAAAQPNPPIVHKDAQRHNPKISRNHPCPCRSGKKYKRCCMLKQAETSSSVLQNAAEGKN
jgi:hypothetical protein